MFGARHILKRILNAEWLPLALIILLALALRLVMIDQPLIDIFSWRQTDTAGFAENFLRFDPNIFVPQLIWNGPGRQPAGYEFQTISYLASIFYRLFGQHEIFGRLIAVTFGVWKVFIFYDLVRRIWTRDPALVATLLLTILPGDVLVDRSFLPDGPMLSLITTSAWAVVRYFEGGQRRFLALAWAAGTLGLLTKISGGILVLPLAYALFDQRHRLVKPAADDRGPSIRLLLFSAVAVLLPVALYYSWALKLANEPPYYRAARDYFIWEDGVSEFVANAFYVGKLTDALFRLWTAPFGLLALGGFFLRPPNSPGLRWFFHAWLTGYGLYYLVAAQGLAENSSNLNVMNPAAAALAANALLIGWRKVGTLMSPRYAAAAVAPVALGFAAHTAYKMANFEYLPWADADRRMGLALHHLTAPDQLVVTSTTMELDTTAIYYSHRRGWTFPPLDRWPEWYDRQANTDAEAIEAMKDLRARGARWYGMVDPQRRMFEQTRPAFVRYLGRFRRLRGPGFEIVDLRTARRDAARR